MARRKLLALDLDGTAVKDDYSMSDSSIEAIRRAQAAGHVLAFVTGRRDVDMLTLGKEQYYVDYHILNTGGKIVRCKDGKIMMNITIDPSSSIRLFNYCIENDLQLHDYVLDKWQVTKMTKGTLEYANVLGTMPEIVSSIDEIDYENIEGFMATQDAEGVAKFIDEKLPLMQYINSEPGTIDIVADVVNKWDGIDALAKIEGIEHRDTIAVGNYYNDMDMIEKAGIGIAVANSLEPVKEIADYVTKEDNNHDAIKEIVDMIMEGRFD